jgi:hypothetical protein
MAAFTARWYNPAIGELDPRLCGRAESFQQAGAACMREAVVLTNTLVAHGRVRDP